MCMMLCSRIIFEFECSVNDLQCSLKATQLTYAVCCTRVDVEVITLAMRASAFFAFPERSFLGSFDLHIFINDLLCSICKVTSDFFHTLNFVILHDNVFTPGEELVVYYFPSWT